MCVCVTGHRYVSYVRFMRWWSSNLGQKPLHNLGNVAYCCVFILDPPRPLFPPSNVLLGGEDPSCPDTPSSGVNRLSSQIIRPTERHLSLSQYTGVPGLALTLFCPCSPPPTLSFSCHAFRIPAALAPLSPTKSFLLCPSDDCQLPPVSTIVL